MASNEVEILDPAPTVEKLEKSTSERVLNRRHFIAALGVAGAAVAGTELVRSGPTALAQQPKPSGYAQVDVLNFLLNIKYLKATLYSYITQGTDLVPTAANPNVPVLNLGTGGVFNPPKQITFTAAGAASAQETTDLFNAMYYDELQDLVTLRSILGAAVLPRATVNLLGTGVSTATGTQTVSQVQAISILRMLEDLSASAFAGASIYLTGTNLQYATQALAVNGFHAGAMRLLAIQNGAPYYSPQDLTTTSAGAQTQNSFTGSLAAGSSTIYSFAPTNPITVGSIITGPSLLPNTTVTAVNPPTVYTGSLSGTTATPNNIITNVSPTTGLAVGMALSGTGIPANAIITNISGSTVTIGVVTAYSPLGTPPTPTTNGVISVTATGGVGMTLGTYPLAFSGGSPVTPAVGTITVLTAGTTLTPGTYTIALTSGGSGYNAAPSVSAATGGTPPALTANMPAQITTTTQTVTLTPGFLAATTKSSANLLYSSPVTQLVPGQMLSGTGVPSNTFIIQGGINTTTGLVTMGNTASATSSVSPTGVVTKGSSLITQVSSVTGILPGMPITGTGIATGATISYSDPNALTITTSLPATANSSASVTPTAFLTKGSNVISDLSSLTGLAAGYAVTGTGIPANTVIGSVGGVNTATMVQASNPTLPANASATTVTSAGGTTNAILQSGNNIVSYVYPIPNGLAAGQLISDPGNVLIPLGTTITGVTAANNTITLSAPATGATTITAVASFTGTVVVSYETISSITPASVLSSLSIGQPISGPNIPYGTVITGVPGNPATVAAGTITISQFPTAALGPELVGATFNVLATTPLTSLKLQTITVATSIETITVTSLATVTPSLGTTTLSQPAILAGGLGATGGTNALIVEGTDNMDVEANDPGTITFAGIVTSGSAAVTGVSSLTGLAVGLLVAGNGIPPGTTIATVSAPSTITLSAAATAGATTATTLFAYLTNSAALSAAGPAAIAGTSPAVYGGFFDTAGAATSSSNTPPGSVFARSFSQVLAVLYGSTTAQTYQGGFFPNGVSGGINFV